MMASKLSAGVEKAALILNRNRMILSITNFPARKDRVNLNWAPLCKPKKGGAAYSRIDTDKQNFGDYLAIPIFDYMTKKYGLDKDKKVKGTKHLYTIGSLILLGYQDATIWGSGILQTEAPGFVWSRSKYRKLDVRAVRGPETRRRLQENGYDVSKCVFGDPGVLMPLIYTPKEYEKKKDYSVILHMSKKDDSIPNQIDVLTDDWQKTIDEIYNSKLIISSSLHGCIIAEAYGVPAILLDRLEGGDRFKYNDYYYSTGRRDYPVCRSVEEGLSMPIPQVPDLTKMQEDLIKSFPVDMWQ
ncbi:polysaccharide pyruvyl transferase family protein [Butyrivibrio sp. MC2021]|uniref:polysaccharide pyruvyl transferase family protein n=1 Tax=Butyrivibrio sp. MC2021 TaxID=1408306 RepID=UPI000684B7D1|nr:polysaccharide pyruvyl transferase family protein [Butyrivibrio sp. MC2021]